MKKFIAFLRGINISGKNKINMSELKCEMESLGFGAVSTYLNSGNIIFTSDMMNIKTLIEKMIAEKFGLEIPVYVIEADELEDILRHAPAWWNTGNKEKYDNLIFILTDDTPEDICTMIGEPSADLECAAIYNNVIFWTFERKVYQKCNWWKRTASAGIADKLTIRTAGTVRKCVASS